jgi:putative FmdB family regulatory protein
MPTYQYHCAKCDQEFDLFQPITDKPLATCTKDVCRMKRWGKGKVKKLISAGAGLIFKGSGFYITDYRSESYKAAAQKDSSAASAGSSDSKSSSAETKPAAKAETKPAKTETRAHKAK